MKPGDRIRLGPLERVHMKTYMQWLNAPEIAALWEDGPCRPSSAMRTQAWLERINAEIDAGCHHYAVHLKTDDTLVGMTSLADLSARDRKARLAIVVGSKPLRGSGVEGDIAEVMLRKAFTELNLNRVWLRAHDFWGEKAIEAIVRAGFLQEGILKEDFFFQGRFWDTQLMGALRSEWAQEHPELLPLGSEGHGADDDEDVVIEASEVREAPREKEGIFFTTDLMVREDDDEE